MNDLSVNTSDADYVDRLIDQVVADPDRVDDVKKLLRHKIAAPDRLNVVDAPKRTTPTPEIDDDVEDLWDNVPI